MTKNYNPNKIQWFVNPWFDIIFLAGFPIVLAVPFMCYLYLQNPYLPFYEYTVMNFTHAVSGLVVVYIFSQGYKKIPLLFLGVLLFSFIGVMTLFTLGHSLWIITIRFYLGTGHVFIQYLFILQLYKLRNYDYLKIDTILDISALMTGPLYLIFYYLFGIQSGFAIGSIFRHSADNQPMALITFLTYFIVISWLLRQVYMYIRWKKISSFKILIVSMAIFNYYFPLTYFSLKNIRDFSILTQALIVFHNLQWIALGWFFYRQRFKERIVEKEKSVSCFSQFRYAALYFFLLFSASVAFNLSVRSMTGSAYYDGVMSPTFAFMHFFIDGTVWIWILGLSKGTTV